MSQRTLGFRTRPRDDGAEIILARWWKNGNRWRQVGVLRQLDDGTWVACWGADHMSGSNRRELLRNFVARVVLGV